LFISRCRKKASALCDASKPGCGQQRLKIDSIALPSVTVTKDTDAVMKDFVSRSETHAKVFGTWNLRSSLGSQILAIPTDSACFSKQEYEDMVAEIAGNFDMFSLSRISPLLTGIKIRPKFKVIRSWLN